MNWLALKRSVAASALLICLVGGAAAPAAAAPGAAAARPPAPRDARLDGTFTMSGTVTLARDVYGEHRGEHVQRTWAFTSTCPEKVCDRVKLVRQRSDQGTTDVLWLHRVAVGTYSGRGRFRIALRCAGRVVSGGGLAQEKIVVRIRSATLVGTTPFATAVTATYENPVRTNLTRCPGGIGRDGAHYRGTRVSPLPGPPVASFTAATDPASTSAACTDDSRPGSGGAALVAWSWNFGDPSSPDDTSTQRNPTHRFTATGIYTVTLQVTDGFGQSATVSEHVTV